MQNDMISEIARTINNNMNSAIKESQYGTGFALGTITETGLNVDNIKQEYSKEDYWILDNLKNPKSITTQSANAPESHTHIVNTPSNQLPLKVGDRVLVALMGVNAIIVGRVSHG